MTDSHFRIVFEGQVLAGVSIETAKLNLAGLFKSEVSAVEKLFSGQPVALKQGLTRADAERYLQALHGAGVQARIEAEPPISLSLDKVEPVQPYTPPAEPENLSPYAPPKAEVDTSVTTAELKVFSLSGRIGRLRYLAWSLALVGALLLISLVGGIATQVSEIFGSLVTIVITLVAISAAVPIGVQRLHDLGWSGWWWLLNIVPVVGGLFPLILIFMPGTPGANAYGPPPPPNGRAVKVIASLWLVAIIAVVLFVLFAGASVLHSISQVTNVTSTQHEQSLSDEQQERSDNARPASGQFFKGGQSL